MGIAPSIESSLAQVSMHIEKEIEGDRIRDIFTTVKMKGTNFWDMTPCTVVEVYRFIGGTRVSDGRAIAQAVSLRLPIAAARVQTRVWSCGIL
jgi:hypothetical protein